MGYYEKEWLSSNYHGVSPSYYAQYVDIFLVFSSNNEAKRFSSYLNSRHSNKKFAIETEVNKVIPLYRCPYW